MKPISFHNELKNRTPIAIKEDAIQKRVFIRE